MSYSNHSDQYSGLIDLEVIKTLDQFSHDVWLAQDHYHSNHNMKDVALIAFCKARMAHVGKSMKQLFADNDSTWPIAYANNVTRIPTPKADDGFKLVFVVETEVLFGDTSSTDFSWTIEPLCDLSKALTIETSTTLNDISW